MAKDPRFVPRNIEQERKETPVQGNQIFNNTITTNHIQNGAITAEKTTFFNNGYIIQPNRPAFLLGWPGNMSVSGVATVPPTGGSVAFNVGSHFNTSTMRFTCPVAGLYCFGYSYLRNPSIIVVRANIFKNGVNQNQQLRTPEGFNGYNYTAGQWSIVYGNVGDYFELKIYADSSTTLYADGGGREYNWFCGYLIG